MRLQRDSYAPKSCAFDAANVQFLRAHLCKSHPVLQQTALRDWWKGLSREENLLDLTPHDHGMECGSGRLFAFVLPRSRADVSGHPEVSQKRSFKSRPLVT